MALHPAIIVHGRKDLQTALAPGRKVTPLTAPGAAMYAGCLWWAELLNAAGFTGLALLDCGDAPGRALEAIKHGLTGIVLTCEAAPFAVIAGIAASTGILVLPAAPPALDMAARDAKRRLPAWLDDTG